MKWKTVKLGEVAAVIAGQSPKSVHYNKDGMGLPFYQGKKEYGEFYLKPPRVWTTHITKKATKDDILMSVRAPVGALNIATQEICIGRGLAAIRVKKKINRNFLFFQLLSVSTDLIGSVGAIFNSINKQQIEELTILLPPLPEQKRIATKLDALFTEIDKAITATERKQNEVDALKIAVLRAALDDGNGSWQQMKLGEVCQISTGKWNANHAIKNGKYRFYTCASRYQYSDTKRFSGECIILPGNGVNVGELYFYNGAFDAYQRTYVIHDIQINPSYLMYFMTSNWKKVNTNKQFGSATNFIRIGNFINYDISYPPLAEQKHIVAKLDALFVQIDILKNTATQKLQHYHALKSAILKQELHGNQRRASI